MKGQYHFKSLRLINDVNSNLNDLGLQIIESPSCRKIKK